MCSSSDMATPCKINTFICRNCEGYAATHTITEHLVDVRIHSHALSVVVSSRQEAVPVAQGLEGIMNKNDGVALLRGSVRVAELR